MYSLKAVLILSQLFKCISQNVELFLYRLSAAFSKRQFEDEVELTLAATVCLLESH